MFSPLLQSAAPCVPILAGTAPLTVQSVKNFAEVLVTSFENIVFMFTSSAPLCMFFWDEGVASSAGHD